jgi:hypothetical protein
MFLAVALVDFLGIREMDGEVTTAFVLVEEETESYEVV